MDLSNILIDQHLFHLPGLSDRFQRTVKIGRAAGDDNGKPIDQNQFQALHFHTYDLVPIIITDQDNFLDGIEVNPGTPPYCINADCRMLECQLPLPPWGIDQAL